MTVRIVTSLHCLVSLCSLRHISEKWSRNTNSSAKTRPRATYRCVTPLPGQAWGLSVRFAMCGHKPLTRLLPFTYSAQEHMLSCWVTFIGHSYSEAGKLLELKHFIQQDLSKRSKKVRFSVTTIPSHTNVRSLWPLACWDCGFESRRWHVRMPVVSVGCCTVEFSASGWSVVQGSLPTMLRRCVWCRNLTGREVMARVLRWRRGVYYTSIIVLFAFLNPLFKVLSSSDITSNFRIVSM